MMRFDVSRGDIVFLAPWDYEGTPADWPTAHSASIRFGGVPFVVEAIEPREDGGSILTLALRIRVLDRHVIPRYLMVWRDWFIKQLEESAPLHVRAEDVIREAIQF